MRRSSSSTSAGSGVQAAGRSFLARHPRFTLLAVLGAGLVLVGGLFELGLRAFGSLNISYYTGTTLPGLHRYGYGDIPINADGYPDEAFVLSGVKPRIGYVGDSVTYGIGAGYGYRVPDLLQERFPQYDHWVFAGVGERLEAPSLLAQIEQFNLSAVVYLMNLNDIVPEADSPDASTWIASRARTSWFARVDLGLRGKSYLYTYVRFGLKTMLERWGYEHHGMKAYEFEPSKYRDVFAVTAKRVADALDQAAARRPGLRTCVVVLPYEMQVSSDAARTYRDLGFSWEPGFENGSAQAVLVPKLKSRGVKALDARDAFAGRELKVGEAYVFNKGDRTDWNHPNRVGHAILASWLADHTDFVSHCYGPTR